jgi:hypothetical protein
MRLPLAVTLLLAACSGFDTTTTTARANTPLAPTVRDSAGIEIAEHPADAFDRAPLITMDTVPLFEIGGEGAELELSRGAMPLVLRDGRLAIYAEGTIHIVDTNGTIVERIGRAGSGPGEFRTAMLSYGRADTVLAQDGALSRISYVVPGVGVVRDRRFVSFSREGMFMPVGGLGGDTIIAATAGFALREGMTGPEELPWRASRLDPGSDSLEQVDSIAGFVLVPSGGEARVRAYDGMPSVVVATDAVITTSGRTWALRVVRPDGVLRRLVRVPAPRRPVDPVMVSADADSQITQFRAMLAERGGSAPQDTTKIFDAIRQMPTADSVGAIGWVWNGGDGVLWVKDGGYNYADSTWAFTAVRADGTLLGRLQGPSQTKIAAFGPGVVVVRAEDDNGFVTLKVHRLNAPR